MKDFTAGVRMIGTNFQTMALSSHAGIPKRALRASHSAVTEKITKYRNYTRRCTIHYHQEVKSSAKSSPLIKGSLDSASGQGA